MLNGLKEAITRIENFSFVEAIEKLLLDNSEVIIESIKNNLESGRDGDDEFVTLYGNPEYSPVTVAIKQKYGSGIGRITSVITNYMTGEFYNSIYFKLIQGDNFEIDSKDPLFEKIKDRSGEDIINLSPSNMKIIYTDYILPILVQRCLNLFYADAD